MASNSRKAETRTHDNFRVQIGLGGTYRGLSFRAGLTAEAVRYDDDRPSRSAPEVPEIFPCAVPRRGSESLLPRRSGGTATGGNHE